MSGPAPDRAARVSGPAPRVGAGAGSVSSAAPALRLATGASGDRELDRRWSARRLALEAAAVEAVGALDRVGIPAILLKGPVTAARLYPGEFRPFVDVDLLVPPAAHRAAAAALGALGYRSTSSGPLAAGLLRTADGCRIDLHRSLGHVRAPAARVWAVLAAHRVPFALHRAVVPALDDAALAFHLALHVAQTGGAKPKPLVDLERAVAALGPAAWAGAWAIAGALGATGPVTAALRLGSPAAGRVADRIGAPRRAPWTYRALLATPGLSLLAAAALPYRQAAGVLRRWLLPSAAERAARLARPDAAGLLPTAPTALRLLALRARQAAGSLRAAPAAPWAGSPVRGAAARGRRARPRARGAPALGRGARLLGRTVPALGRGARALAGLPRAERALFVRYLAAVAGLEVALHCVGPARVIRWWAATARRGAAPGAAPLPAPGAVSPRRRCWLATRAAAVLRPGRTCLPVAMLAWREALAAGAPARLVIGVRTAPEFRAHAWVVGADRPGPPDGSAAGLTPLAAWGADGRPVPVGDHRGAT